jgi:hypothetical protein
MAAHAKQHAVAHRKLDSAAVHAGFVAFYRALANEVGTCATRSTCAPTWGG